MKALRVHRPGGPAELCLEDVDDPLPGPGDLVVRVELAGVNYADVNARRGVYAADPGVFPLTPGLEVYGTVTAVGADVSTWRTGDPVAGFTRAGYAELAVVPQRLAYRVPEGVPPAQAAAFPVTGLTAYHLLTSSARPRPDDWLLVTAAAGGVGTALVRQARLLGHDRLLVAAGSPERLDYARRLGAVDGIDYAAADLTAGVLRATDGHGVDVAFDAVGGAVRESCLRALAPFGRLVQYGNACADRERLPEPRELRRRNIAVVGFHLGTLRDNLPGLLADGARRLLSWLRQGELEFTVADILPLADGAHAHRLLEARAVTGKLLLAP